jgi:eight-cysteine-cluster-containing protein
MTMSQRISPHAHHTNSACIIGGCSGQLCINASNNDMITTCEYRAEYACYKGAECKRQSDGNCGWTVTPAMKQCLANPPALGGATAY